MALLYLGSCDASKYPNNRKDFLKTYHRDGILVGKKTFRDDDRGKWRSFRKMMGNDVEKLQRFLVKAGFMTDRIKKYGVFDYATQAAVRLFQEYVRTIDKEGDKNILPDGMVGEKQTMKHIQRWKEQNKVCKWGPVSATTPSQEYNAWFRLLDKAKTHYRSNPGPILKHVNGLDKTYSTRKVDDWTFNKNQIHLIGIRRNQHLPKINRENDDVFVLLVNGQVFKFWGSTDPNVEVAKREDEAFLVEGQHEYRFGWHKQWEDKKIYRAAKPLDPKGVLILRDWDHDNSLSPKDLDLKDRNGNLLGLRVNNEINIHWSGIGGYNFSAGCQVVSGKSYINHEGQLVNCSKFASKSYRGLSTTNKKTKGAYNVLADLVVCYTKPGVNNLVYTLGREESLNIDASFGAGYAKDALRKMTNIGN